MAGKHLLKTKLGVRVHFESDQMSGIRVTIGWPLYPMTKGNRGVSLEWVINSLNVYLPGWLQYFSKTTGISLFRDMDSWIRRRLRCYRLKQRKRKWPIATWLMKLGVSRQNAWRLAKSDKSWWRKSHNPIINMAMPNEWFEASGLFSLYEKAKALKA